MTRRRKRHEETHNHEAWAIPYADLLTLLLAFFVVMYAISQVNEGKYRILSDSLVAAFRGSPRTLEPIQVGEKQVGSGSDIKMSVVQPGTLQGQPRQLLEAVPIAEDKPHRNGPRTLSKDGKPLPESSDDAANHLLPKVADDVEIAMQDLVRERQVVVRRYRNRVEIEIRTDILFQSGSTALSGRSAEIIARLADTLAPFPNAIRVEGHTDDVPIRTVAYRSNWELSAARAATVVLLMSQRGLPPQRLAVLGFGEFRPVTTNATAEGRNINRRVLLVVTGADGLNLRDNPDDIQLQATAPADSTPEAPDADSTAAASVAAPAITPIPQPFSTGTLAAAARAAAAAARTPATPAAGTRAGTMTPLTRPQDDPRDGAGSPATAP